MADFRLCPPGTWTPEWALSGWPALSNAPDGFRDFTCTISNYESDVFRPIFQKIAELSGKSYGRTLPASRANLSEQEKVDVAFRVVADHIRTLSMAIADGIVPGNTDRHYVLRRILRRAVMFGRYLGFGADGFLSKLVPTMVDSFGSTFPELKLEQQKIVEVLDSEEVLFNRTSIGDYASSRKNIDQANRPNFSSRSRFQTL